MDGKLDGAVATDRAEAVASPTKSRGLRILARQQVTMVEVPEFWDGIDDVSIIEEHPRLVSEPIMVRNALAVRRLLLSTPISIEDDELIVGTFRAKKFGQPRLPDYTTAEEKTRFGITDGFARYGHCAADYDTLIKVGLKGIRAEAQAALDGLVRQAGQATERKAAFYRSIIIICDTLRDFAGRYAALAGELADRATDPLRAQELRKIASVCRRVPENAATSFHEALQSVILHHVAVRSVYFDGALGRLDQSLYPLLQADLDKGAITDEEAQELVDCFLLKINDTAWHASLSGDDANMGIFGTYFSRGGGLHELVLGGQTSDGSSAANRVTYMMLDATRRLAFIYPIVSVRLPGKEDDRLLRASCEAIRAGGGMPVLYNDDVFVPALVRAGISLEDARDYANDGCWEVTINGKTAFSYVTFSAVKSLEWVLTRGQGLPIDWKRALGWKKGEPYEPLPASELSVDWPTDLEPHRWYAGDATDGVRSIRQPYGTPIDTGDPCAFQTFEELLEALELQLDHQVMNAMTRWHQRFVTDAAVVFGVRGPASLGSLLIRDCLKKGKAYGHGGERYFICGLNPNTIPNVTDSLCAIRKFVFEDRLFTMEQLIGLLQSNFEGAEDIRYMLATRAPKYGNGDKAADALAARLLNSIADSVDRHSREFPAPEGYRRIWGLLSATFEWAARYGCSIGATPDGRPASEPVATNLSPSIGAAMEGPTASLRSQTSLPLDRLITGGALDLTMDGTTLEGEAGLERLVGFVRSFVELGGSIMTITVADGETLRRAQKEPSNYRHLRVRLGGQQAYFTGLSRDMQDWCIARVEGGLAY